MYETRKVATKHYNKKQSTLIIHEMRQTLSNAPLATRSITLIVERVYNKIT